MSSKLVGDADIECDFPSVSEYDGTIGLTAKAGVFGLTGVDSGVIFFMEVNWAHNVAIDLFFLGLFVFITAYFAWSVTIDAPR